MYQPDISRIADQNPYPHKKIKTNNPLQSEDQENRHGKCVFSLCLLPSVVTFSASLSFPQVACQANLTGSVRTGWCHHDGAMQRCGSS